MPHLELERAAGGIVAGIDEAGRGPWAGPVVAAAVVLDETRLPPDIAAAIDDSKKLTAERRLALIEAIRCCAWIGIGAASAAEIDRLNILQATYLAMQRALRRLPVAPCLALVDGNRAPALPCRVQTVIGGDALSLSIAAASIVAKVTRDRAMQRLDLRYAGYGWSTNVGYGTAEHQAGLASRGPTRHHRQSFRPIQMLLAPAVGDALA
ncbi:ribonuclease HII [Oceanibaculum pacificum]|uniref:Ribonuclease HII n=1 Tax=Oceanibaculum pacificum TaxID=580166 RepID=A0A154WH46_9PROT|nr:ribonuclease HII [Oceanibaculum pacificum]KZD12864.1 ribonuclease HII [Oceanibaculum pacificum]